MRRQIQDRRIALADVNRKGALRQRQCAGSATGGKESLAQEAAAVVARQRHRVAGQEKFGRLLQATRPLIGKVMTVLACFLLRGECGVGWRADSACTATSPSLMNCDAPRCRA